MSKGDTRMVRLPVELEPWLNLRKLAVGRQQSIGELVADALRRDRVTKQAFQPKEDGK